MPRTYATADARPKALQHMKRNNSNGTKHAALLSLQSLPVTQLGSPAQAPLLIQVPLKLLETNT
jgi:hypothetical protein